jgi:2,3-bisphosphoglycerate-independent phosphoglycerate mutase
MDKLARNGICGMHDPVQGGLACGSDTAHMSIFGYNPLKLYNGRGAFEAMGSGLDMIAGVDIAFKCNFAYFNEETLIVERRRVDREFPEWGKPLCDVIDGMEIPGFSEYKVSCSWATEHRCGIKVSGPGLSYHITGQDPLKDNKPVVKV